MIQRAVQSRFEHLPIRFVEHIHSDLGFADPLAYPAEWRHRPLKAWDMQSDDCVLRYLFRNFRPDRHLEFGTWQGDGVVRCCEECDATVWTLNLLEGESKPNGEWAYGSDDASPLTSPGQIERLVTESATWIRTDAYGMIGHRYLERGFGSRVCQIYTDSRQWDTSQYPDGFFDSAFIDGGHGCDVVRADTATALRLVRPGGLLMWHDFCPLEEAVDFAAARDVGSFVAGEQEELLRRVSPLFWIEPTWLLVGIKRS